MITKLYDSFEEIWERYSVIISILVGILFGVFYKFGFVTNVRSVTGNIVMLASIVIGVNGVFLTLVITLQESPAFLRLREFFPTFQERLYISLRNQIHYALVVVIISIFINILPPSPNIYFSSIGVSIWFIFFTLMGVGSFISVKLVTDIIVKSFDLPTRKRRQ
ncbi:hypothetical protein V7182_04530 [Neobacillus drentensis]|uniref:hypothetical protein n=1 Tax=Neobacillus drentensis TaxID=220684 RepID=UPI002FFEC220